MFNVYLHDKKLQQTQSLERKSADAIKLRQKSMKARERLCSSYQRRVNQFMIQMLEKPIELHEYQRPLEIAARVSDPSKFKGNAIFVMKGFKTEKQRIKEAVSNNQFLESEPYCFKEEFRSRYEDKEIHQRMYFKPKTSLDRVKETLQARHLVIYIQQIDELTTPSKPRPHNFSKSAHSTQAEFTSMESPKQILSNLHNKTHFKAVSSLLLSSTNHPTSRSEATSSNAHIFKKGSIHDGDLNNEEAELLAKEVLEKCRVRTALHSDYLKTGSGKLISNPDVPNVEVYGKLLSSTSDNMSRPLFSLHSNNM